MENTFFGAGIFFSIVAVSMLASIAISLSQIAKSLEISARKQGEE